MFANYTFERNELELLKLFGYKEISNRKDENDFMKVLFSRGLSEHYASEEKLWQNHTVIILQGGFCDTNSAFCYRISSFLKEYFASEYSAGKLFIFYREHDEHKDSLALVNYFNAQNCKVVVIGHSWGGSSATLQVSVKSDKPIKLLISLDPVGIFRPSKKKIPKTDYWLNVYVDYNLADYKFHNNVARLGQAWEFSALASENISSEILHHEKAKDLFIKYALEKVEKILRF